MIDTGSRLDKRSLSLDELDGFQFHQVPLYDLQGIKIIAKERIMKHGKTPEIIF